MLCDDIVQNGINTGIHPPHIFKPIIERIKHAMKFILTPEFTQAADVLAEDYVQVAKALEFCRLPYDEIWVECSQSHRLHFVKGGKIEPWQGIPLKIGFLMKATSMDFSCFKVHQFWTVQNPLFDRIDRCVGFLAAEFDMKGEELSSEELARIGEGSSESWKRAPLEVRRRLMSVMNVSWPDFPVPQAAGSAYDHMAVMDWTGEPPFIEATLALLNCRNVHQTEYVDKTEHNRKRARRGHAPLASYHLVKIHPHHIVRAGTRSNGEDHAALRAHFVRGHFKHRATGLYFWRPHARGNASAGRVNKDYEVHAV